MKLDDLSTATSDPRLHADEEDFGSSVSLIDLMTWVGEAKRALAAVTLGAALLSIGIVFQLPLIYTARTTLLPPASQQSGGASAALVALGALGGLAGGLGAKTPDELFVALLKSDSMMRALDARFGLLARYEIKTQEELRKALPNVVKVMADRKSGVISVEVDDKDPKFAAELANAHATEITKLLGRLAVSEAQLRRSFFEQQLKETKENLVKAELGLRAVQEKSGVIVLDKQAEALITSVAQLRAMIAEREVQLKVLRTSATGQNPDVLRLNSEVAAMRTGAHGIVARRPARQLERQRGRHSGRPDSRSRDRLRACAARTQAAGNPARKHGAAVRDRQARRGQRRAGAAASRRRAAAGSQVQTGARPDRAREHDGRLARRPGRRHLAPLCGRGARTGSAACRSLAGDATRLALAALSTREVGLPFGAGCPRGVLDASARGSKPSVQDTSSAPQRAPRRAL
jgi:hypothetical protein